VKVEIRYTARGAFWPTEDDRPAAERTVSGGETSWVVRDASILPSPHDMFVAAGGTKDSSRWMVNGPMMFDPLMTFVEIELKMADGTLHRSAWEAFLRAVGDMEQLGLSPLEPLSKVPGSGERKIHRPLSGETDKVSRLGHLP
jgi:hypothetical protein